VEALEDSGSVEVDPAVLPALRKQLDLRCEEPLNASLADKTFARLSVIYIM